VGQEFREAVGVTALIGLGSMALVALAGIAGLWGAHRWLTAGRATDPDVLPFLSGFPPAAHALSRYHVRWYPLTLLFLAFDVEMLFMYPWAVVVAEVGASAVIEMFVFLALLMAGVFWAYREGALRWV
jgi:NADH:ubiquinone oxidoreductase subunit 3 (subunit A)